MNYIQIKQNDTLPDILELKLYKCVVVIEDDVPLNRQNEISDWLVSSGCMYMMAWGRNCSSWDDSVDDSNLAQFDFQDIPDESLVITTWHDKEPLSEVFEFAKHTAHHENYNLTNCVILHLSPINKTDEFEKLYKEV